MIARENVLKTPVGIPFHRSLPVLILQLSALLRAGVFSLEKKVAHYRFSVYTNRIRNDLGYIFCRPRSKCTTYSNHCIALL